MTTTAPTDVRLDARFSSPGAEPVPWDTVASELEGAMLYWLTTVRAGGRPHVTPVAGVWRDGVLHFCTGTGEQKARNLAANPACLVTTGRNVLEEGVDVVVEADAVAVTDEPRLHALAGAWFEKYGDLFRFDVVDGAFHSEEGGRALVFAVAPARAFAFAKGDTFGQTGYRFAPG
jgi:Pyridoxamine 5'-phosphate oxidase